MLSAGSEAVKHKPFQLRLPPNPKDLSTTRQLACDGMVLFGPYETPQYKLLRPTSMSSRLDALLLLLCEDYCWNLRVKVNGIALDCQMPAAVKFVRAQHVSVSALSSRRVDNVEVAVWRCRAEVDHHDALRQPRDAGAGLEEKNRRLEETVRDELHCLQVGHVALGAGLQNGHLSLVPWPCVCSVLHQADSQHVDSARGATIYIYIYIYTYTYIYIYIHLTCCSTLLDSMACGPAAAPW